MENLKGTGIHDLSINEKAKISGGGVHPLVWMFVFHVAKEAYNDWDAHVDAFNRGRASV